MATPPLNIAYKNVVKFIKDSKLNNNFNMYDEIKNKYLTPPYNSKKSIIIKYYIWDILKKNNIDDSEKDTIIEIINKLKEDNTVGSKTILVYIIDSIKIFKINSSTQKKNILTIFNKNTNLKEYITGTASAPAPAPAGASGASGAPAGAPAAGGAPAPAPAPTGVKINFKVGNKVSFTNNKKKHKHGKLKSITSNSATVSVGLVRPVNEKKS